MGTRRHRSIILLCLALLTLAGCSFTDDADDSGAAATVGIPAVTASATTAPVGQGDVGTPEGGPAPRVTVTGDATAQPKGSGGQTLVAPVKPARPDVSGDQTLVMAGSDAGPETLDPALVRDAESSFYTRQIFRGLVRLDDDLGAQPDLADRIEIAADGRVYVFRLRANATFHDGARIDAAAVVASLNRAANPALAGGDGFALPAAIYLIDIEGARERLAGERDSIAGVVAIDDRTVQITLVAPTANFLYKLSGNAAQIVDTSTATGDDWWESPNGSGPFRLGRWDAEELTLEAFDGFYDGRPLLDQVVVRLGRSAAQPLNLYESGAIDITDVPFYAVDRVLSETDSLHADLTVVPQLSTAFIVLNPNVEPFDDPEARAAVVLAFDRAKVANVSLDGKVTPASGIVPPGIGGRDWPADYPDHDLATARERLAGAAPLTVPATFYGSGAAVSIAQVLERDLGIDADAIALDWSTFTARLAERSLPAFSLSWIADFPDAANFLTSLFLSSSPDNYIGYANPEVDRLLLTAETEQDDAERERLYLHAQQLIIDDHVLIPLYHDVSYTVVQPWVRDLTITPVGILSLEDAWIDD